MKFINKVNMKAKLLIFLVIAALLSGCGLFSRSKKQTSNTTGWNYNDPETGNIPYTSGYKQEGGPGLVFIEGGTFTMGRVEEDVMSKWDNVPRRITVASFWMDEAEVSNQDYREYLYWISRVYPNDRARMEAALPDTLQWREELAYNEPYIQNYLRHPAYSDYPVVGVSWIQAEAYASWRTDRVNEQILVSKGIMAHDMSQNGENVFTTDTYLTGLYTGTSGRRPQEMADGTVRPVRWEDGILLSRYRLPTEAEWEYAARAGSTSALPNGELQGAVGEALLHDPGLDQIGWYVGNAELGAHPVAQKQPNGWGFYDMHGNVQEWVADWHNSYPFNAVIDPAGPEQGLTKIRRGGSWNLYARLCRSASRAWASPSLFDPFTGLRLVAYAKPHATSKTPETSPVRDPALSVTSWEIFFELDSAALTPAMSAKLADIAGSVIHTDEQLVLEGHTCDLAADAYNQKLSEQRVRSVKHFLVNQGIPDQRIHSQAFGERQPGYPNDSGQGRKLNRRVVIHLN
ncbi:MAG TPA: hypothetical protein DCY35_10865 [Prolixibacteraceae bacterium]|nr:hypothetical protein [Prolixibacteraceae bacterium]